MMASDPNSELSLECKPHSYSMLLKSMGEQEQQQISDQTHHKKLEEFLACLEEERLKIDAFKRELPLCMQLLTNAMETSRQQLHSYRAKPVVEEFIPLKHPNSNNCDEGLIIEKTKNPSSDKANWMTSAQLWSQASGDHHHHQETKQHESSDPKDSDLGFVSANLKQGLEFEYNNQRTNGGGGAFIPFSKERNRLPELALANASLDDHDHKEIMEEKNIMNNNNSQMNTTTINNGATHRKARRCWSPDLHRRFVNALHILGGSQVATPKQIRELMKVDGLTNDEVKSHLQKYRLHTRRPSPTPQAAAAATAPQLLVLGGIWVPTEYAAAHHGGHYPTTHHPSPAHYCSTDPKPQEFYASTTPPQAAAHHHQIHVYQPASQTQSSPESDVRGGTEDRSESIEDGKSECNSWKADSNGDQNGGERKGLVLRGEEGEESNGSEITLKF